MTYLIFLVDIFYLFSLQVGSSKGDFSLIVLCYSYSSNIARLSLVTFAYQLDMLKMKLSSRVVESLSVSLMQ